jgi:hypothetical protein
MARVVSERRLLSSPPSFTELYAFDPRIITDNVSEIFNEAAKDYSRPILAMEPDAWSS